MIFMLMIVSGKNSLDDLKSLTDELKLVLMKGGFMLKGITVSGSKPPAVISSDGEFISVAESLRLHLV